MKFDRICINFFNAHLTMPTNKKRQHRKTTQQCQKQTIIAKIVRSTLFGFKEKLKTVECFLQTKLAKIEILPQSEKHYRKSSIQNGSLWTRQYHHLFQKSTSNIWISKTDLAHERHIRKLENENSFRVLGKLGNEGVSRQASS